MAATIFQSYSASVYTPQDKKGIGCVRMIWRWELMQEEEKQENEIQRDPFSKLMFGKGRTSHDKTTEEEGSQHEQYDWLLGRKHPIPPKGEESSSEGLHHTIGRFMQNIDYVETMKHIDTLMTSANELKPLLSKVKPIIETFTQKK